MSIATRINAIEEHIGNAYDKLDDLGIDLTNVDKNIDNIAEMIDTVYEEYPKVTGTGTEVTLDGTKVGKLSLDVKGNSTQETTTGYQLLNLEDGTLTDQGVTRIIDNGKIILNGTPTSDSYNKPLYTFTAPQTGNYALLPFKSSTNRNIRFIYQINSGTWISNDSSNEISLSQGDVLKINLRISATTSINNFILSPLLYLGNYDESKKWEEYTGRNSKS